MAVDILPSVWFSKAAMTSTVSWTSELMNWAVAVVWLGALVIAGVGGVDTGAGRLVP